MIRTYLRQIPVVCFLSFLFLSSCQITGLTTDYHKLKFSEKEKVRPFSAHPDSGLVYQINGEQLQFLLRQQEQSLVYLWTPQCTGPACIPLKKYAAYADRHQLKLIVVADGYHEVFDDKSYPYKYVINHKAYGSGLRLKYRRRFVRELLPQMTTRSQDHNYFIFSGDSLLTSGFTNAWKWND